MTVKELKKQLEAVDENRIVILQKDSEGNSFSPLDGIDDNSVYDADSSYSGEVYYEKLTDELKEQGHDEGSVGEGKPALVLWPIN
jgi:intein/homing endonuclease